MFNKNSNDEITKQHKDWLITLSNCIYDYQNSKDAINYLLNVMGNQFVASRVYVVEFNDNDTFSNTYEWCNEQIVPQIENLKEENNTQIYYWMNNFKQKKSIIIKDLEEIKNKYAITYALLKSQDIHSIICTPIFIEDKLIGFLGLDNPKSNEFDYIADLMNILSRFISIGLKLKNFNNHVEYFKNHDVLTSLLNRNAFENDIRKNKDHIKSLGILYCDVSGLQTLNNIIGYEAGNELLCEWSNMLLCLFSPEHVYRIGSDEFVVFCENITQKEFERHKNTVDKFIQQSKNHMSIGAVFCDEPHINISKLILDAQKEMFHDKARYYCSIDPLSGIPRERRSAYASETTQLSINLKNDDELYDFLTDNYFDIDSFFDSMSIADHYPFFGDMQNNMFYVSEPFCKIFGFKSPLIKDLLKIWENFIPYQEDLEMYRRDLSDILKYKKEIHDLRYKVKDKNNEEFWIRCCGLIKWDKNKTRPLFFSGAVSKLNYSFTIDPVTNFPKEQVATRHINDLQETGKKLSFVGFRVNNFEKINELRGRNVANNLLKDISTVISQKFAGKVQLYRLDGLRFMAILNNDAGITSENFAKRAKEIIYDLYHDYNLSVRFPCSVGILSEIKENATAHDIIADIISLLEIAKNNPDEDIVYSTQIIDKRRNQNRMIMALSHDVMNNFQNFRVVIQPVVSAKTHKIVSGEMLLRWKYEDKDISPVVFIPILEEIKLILPVGKWVFEQAVAQCKRINTYNPNFYLNFNVSYHQVTDKDLPDFMKKTLNKWQLDGNNLVMELTETHYNDNPAGLSEFVTVCKKMNMRVALDDFGVGYSSLDLLLQYPADIVKLDRSLVKRMSDSQGNNDFISSIVYACHKFGKIVCVEGVETDNDLISVTEAGCDTIQGFYFFRPMELKEFYNVFSK